MFSFTLLYFLQTKTVSVNYRTFDPEDPCYEIPFDRLEKRERINKGPYQPKMTFPRTKIGDKNRSFQVIWYEQFHWLEYSKVLDAAFCFYCRCFSFAVTSHRGHIDQAFIKKGFKSWNCAIMKFKIHQKSSMHVGSSNSLDHYTKQKPIDVQLEKEKERYLNELEKKKLNNQSIMKRLIDIIICLAKGGRPFRGHDECSVSSEKRLFLDICELLSRYDPVLKNHIDNGPKNAQYLSHQIQNEIIASKMSCSAQFQ